MKPKARYIEEALGFAANHALYRADGISYHHLQDFPAILFDSSGYLWLTKDDYEAKNSSFYNISYLSKSGTIIAKSISAVFRAGLRPAL